MMFLWCIVVGYSIFQLLIPIQVLTYSYILIGDQNNLNSFNSKNNVIYIIYLSNVLKDIDGSHGLFNFILQF